jgi:hypothetical protein
LGLFEEETGLFEADGSSGDEVDDLGQGHGTGLVLLFELLKVFFSLCFFHTNNYIVLVLNPIRCNSSYSTTNKSGIAMFFFST